MKNYVFKIWILIIPILLLTACSSRNPLGTGDSVKDDSSQYLSPIELVASNDGSTLYIAEHTARQIAIFSRSENKVKDRISLPKSPSGLTLSKDQKRLYVTGLAPVGEVFVIDLEKSKIIETLKTGHYPHSPILSPDERQLYVCNKFDNDVSIIDLESKEELKRIPVAREPIASALTSNGHFLLVANHLHAGPANADFVAAKVSVIDTHEQSVVADISLPNGSIDVQDICLSPDDRFAYVTHILARYQLPTTQLKNGWINTNTLSVIDVARQKLKNTIILDGVNAGAATPWGVECSPDGSYVCVTHAGTHEMSVIDRQKLHLKLDTLSQGQAISPVSQTAADVPNDMSFLTGIRQRISLGGNGPRGLTIDNHTAFVAEYFSNSLGIVELNPSKPPRPQSIALGTVVPMTQQRRGEMLFNDASQCYQQWQSCASCHPSDARVDGLNWELLNDGIGNPKNVKSMLLAHETPPAMITGVRASAEVAVRAGMTHIQLAQRSEEDLNAIDEYLKSLTPVPSPHLVNGKLSPAAQRGKEIYQEIRCDECHGPPLYTDMKLHDVGSAEGIDIGRDFDTPTLIEVWRTAPYMHNGKAQELIDIFIGNDILPEDKHATWAKHLSRSELEDLCEYVASIGPYN